MDIKAEIEKIVDKIKNDKDLLSKFKTDPVKAVESIIGKDLPDDTIKQVVDAVKAKISVDTAKDIAGKIGGLFGKK